MGCGTSKEAVVSSDGSGRCSRKLFRRKSSVVATGAHQPLAAKDNGDVVKHHKAASAPEKAVKKGSGKAGAAAPVFKGSHEVTSTVIGAKVIGKKKAGEDIKKDGKEVAIAATDAKGEKETASEKFTGEKKDEGVRDKEVAADLIKDDVASATGSVVIVQEEEEGTENGEPVEVSIVADERDDEEGVSSAGANDEEGWSTEKDIEEIAVDEDGSTVTFADAPVGVATVEDDGALISVDAPATEEDEITDFPAATVAGDDDVAAPVAKEDELVSFASAPLAEEVDGVILPVAPVGEAVDVAGFTVTPVAKPIGSVASIDAPVAKKDENVTVAATPEVPEDDVAATVDAAASTTANEDEGVMSTAAPASTEDEGAPTVDVAAPTTTNYDETVASAAAPVANEDESLTSPAASEVEEAEQPTPSGNDDELRNEQELPAPTDVEEAASEADDETEQAKEAEEVVNVEELNVEQEEDESVVPQEPEQATSAAASRNDDGESDGKQAVALNDAPNTDQLTQGEEPSVEEKRDDEEPAVAPIESSLS
ncbi:hypothetical protein ACQ4PT_059243 [Festuca glaucescens]